MDILPTLALLPGAPAAPESAAPSGDDPFLALLAGLMQSPAKPAAPSPIHPGPVGDAIATTAAGPGQAMAVLPPAPALAPMPADAARETVNIGAAPPAAETLLRSDPSPMPLVAPELAIDVALEPPMAAEAQPIAPPSRRPDAERTPAMAETATPTADLRPKSLPLAQRPTLGQPDEGGAIEDDPGDVPVVPPLPTTVTAATQPGTDGTSADSPGPAPADLAATAPEAAPPSAPATERRPADVPAAPPLPVVQLPTPDHRGRPVTARLVVVDGVEGSRVRIDLEPADLGRVEVALRLDDTGAATARFTVDRPETLQLLQRDARIVNELLSNAGFTVDQGGLDFSLRDPGERPGGGGRQQPGPGRADDGFAGESASGEPAPLYRRGLLDLRV